MLHHGGVVVEYGAYPVRTLAELVGIVVLGTAALIDVTFVHHYGVLGSVQHRRLAPRILPAVREVVVDARRTLLAALGRNEDDTVSCTRTVNCTRRGILQHLDTLDVVGVEIVDTARYGQTVDDVERVGAVDRAHTADTHLRRGVGSTRRLGNRNTRGHTLQHVVDTSVRLRFQVLGRDTRNRCRHDALLLNAVSDDDDLVDIGRILFQYDVENGSTPPRRNSLGTVSEERNDQRRIALRNIDSERAVDVARRTERGTLHCDRRSDNRRARRILDGTCHLSVLRIGASRHRHDREDQNDLESQVFHRLLLIVIV